MTRLNFSLTAATVWLVATPVVAQGTDATLMDDAAAAHFFKQYLGSQAEWLFLSLGSLSVWRVLAAAATLFLVLIVRRVLSQVVLKWLARMAARTETTLDDQLVAALDPSLRWFVTASGTWLATLWLQLSPETTSLLLVLYRIAMVLIVARTAYNLVPILSGLLRRLAARTDSALDDHLVPLVEHFLHISIVVVASVLVIQELGYNVGALIAGLGVGSLAVALAAKDTLANWFGAMMIYTDRPFVQGDWIKTGALEGVVEEIGLRSTRIRTFAKTVISVPNSVLANDNIENFSRMPLRRVYFHLGVTYNTSPLMMRESLERIREILREHPGVDQGMWLVRFTDFGESALNIMVYYFTNTTAWDSYLQIREDINLRIIASLHEIGVHVAFPTRTLVFNTLTDDERASLDEKARTIFASRGGQTRGPGRIEDGPAEAGAN